MNRRNRDNHKFQPYPFIGLTLMLLSAAITVSCIARIVT